MPNHPPSRVSRRSLTDGGFFAYEPLGDGAVIRFRLDDRNTIEVSLDGDELHLHHDSEDRLAIAVRPEVANVMSIVLVSRKD